MNHKDSCHYSTRLITKLKKLDNKNVLDFPLIDKAICWAKKYHDGQHRKSGEPFYTHPLEVAYMISDYKLKTDIIVASILHDIVEDTEVTVGMILVEFGHRISEMVDMLTRDRPDGTKLSVEKILNNAFERGDNEVLLVKIVDRLHNMQTIQHKTMNKQIDTSLETINDVLAYATVIPCEELERMLNMISTSIAMPEQVSYLNNLYCKQFSYGKYQLPALD